VQVSVGVRPRGAMGGGGGGVSQVSAERASHIPWYVDAGAMAAAGVCSAVAVAPFLTIVDRSVVAASAGTEPLFRAAFRLAAEFVTRPHVALVAPSLWMVAGVYGATYATANCIEVACQRSSTSATTSGAAKFVGVTGVNMSASIAKDAAFAKMFGAPSGAAAAVPLAAYGLFAVRDCLTIGGAFVVPPLIADAAVKVGGYPRDSASTAAQLTTPMGMQLVCTPLHLMALDVVNAPGSGLGSRAREVAGKLPPALLARMLRMLPAYGIGGLLNTRLTRDGRSLLADYYEGVETGELAPLDFLAGWNALHQASLAREAEDAWDALLGGRKMTKEEVSAFLAHADGDGDGQLSVTEVEALLDTYGGFGGCKDKHALAIRMVKEADKDGDGRISVTELEDLLHRHR